MKNNSLLINERAIVFKGTEVQGVSKGTIRFQPAPSYSPAGYFIYDKIPVCKYQWGQVSPQTGWRIGNIHALYALDGMGNKSHSGAESCSDG